MLLFGLHTGVAFGRAPAVEKVIQVDYSHMDNGEAPVGYKFHKKATVTQMNQIGTAPVWLGIALFFLLPMGTWFMIYRKHKDELEVQHDNVLSFETHREHKASAQDQDIDQDDDDWKQAS